eukprot:jgi/Psemu1/327657/estExt_fgenesh1_pg.C_7660001
MTTTTIDGNKSIVMFASSLVKHTASHLRLPANYVGVRSARHDFKKAICTTSSAISNQDKDKIARHKASNDVKFCVVDENGNERRMTKAEKKVKKLQLAQAKKEAKKEGVSKKKRKFEATMVDVDVDGNNKNLDPESNNQADNEATEPHEIKLQRNEATVTTYHQLPLNPATMEQELNEFKGKRGNSPPQILSPPMTLHFVSIGGNLTRCEDAILAYDHNLSLEWANRLKEQCVLPAEAVRQKEDLRPLAYRLQPEPWQRLRPTLEENAMPTTKRNHSDGNQESTSLSSASGSTMINDDPKPCEWVPLTCRPRLITSEKREGIQHDDILSIVFEYIHRETSFHVSCGSKFGSDFLIYDGPREERHAFAGLRVLSRFTNSMTSIPASTSASTSMSTSTSTKSSSENDPDSTRNQSSRKSEAQLPLPSAYSLTGFVRCLNTAGKLALLATVDEVPAVAFSESFDTEKKLYRVAFVDVALEKVLDVHKRKNRGRSDKKKLQKRRDVTRTLSKR